MPILRSRNHPSKMLGRQQLRSWGVLIERDGKDYPSNAFAILTGNGGLHACKRNVACSKAQRKRYLLTVENIPVRFGSR